MIQHNFLEYYESGERKPAEYKSITVIKNKEVLIYQIDFTKHSEEYDFYNSQQIVDDFLLNVYRLFKPKNKVLFKADFSIENIQNASVVSPNTIDIKVFVIGVVMFIVEFTLTILLFLKFATIS